jgi:hypothetical protein
MTRRRHAFVLAGLLVVWSAVPSVAQTQPQGAGTGAPTLAEILQELRALRADLNEAMAAGLRAQLLVARLALQEQRISGVGREMAEVAEKLHANEQAKPMAALLKNMGASKDAAPGSEPAAANPFFDAIRNQAEALEKSDEELKARYAELSRLMADEQSRWTAFNAQLEALETGAASGRR